MRSGRRGLEQGEAEDNGSEIKIFREKPFYPPLCPESGGGNLVSFAGKTVFVVLFSLVLLLTAFSQERLFAGPSVDEMTAAIQNRLKAADGPDSSLSAGEGLSFPAEMRKFYTRRGFRPAWIDVEGPLPAATSLLKVLQQSSRHGLRPEDYHAGRIKSLLPGIMRYFVRGLPLSAEQSMNLDFLLTDAFFLYASHLSSGKVNPEEIKAQWFIRKRTKPNLSQTLEKALESGEVEAVLENLAPSSPSYVRLMAVLREYREIDQRGGWPVIPAGASLKEGDRSERVPLLLERLGMPGRSLFGGDPGGSEREALYDESIVQAVKKFQQSHGLSADGAVGPGTLAALNIPAAERIRQIEINLERHRWMPDDLGDPRVIVNIPEFKLRVIENGKEVMTSRIVVGNYARNTPVFDSRISHFILNPYWYVPRSIAVEEILPLIRKYPEYFNWENMKVLSGSSSKIIPPWEVDWDKVTPQNFNVQLRQDPGPKNALGRIKFMFPNSFDVYLHDTPDRRLFERVERSFSHGCIRVENPARLAAILQQGKSGASEKEILAAMDTGKRKLIRLPRAVRIYVLYFTVWVDADGTVQFPRDVYSYDASLRNALEKTANRSGSGKHGTD